MFEYDEVNLILVKRARVLRSFFWHLSKFVKVKDMYLQTYIVTVFFTDYQSSVWFPQKKPELHK